MAHKDNLRWVKHWDGRLVKFDQQDDTRATITKVASGWHFVGGQSNRAPLDCVFPSLAKAKRDGWMAMAWWVVRQRRGE